MSESAAIAFIVVLDIAFIGFLAWMMSHPRHLTPHVSSREDGRPLGQRFFMNDPAAVEDNEPELILQRTR